MIQSELHQHPFVSVIVPLYNEGSFILRSLGALVDQTYSKDRIEIIVADGGSTDDTRPLVQQIAAGSTIPIRLVDNDKKIAAAGLNQALLIAKGDIVVRVDGHTIVGTDYVSECVEALIRTQVGNVGGKMNAVSEGLVGRAISMATSSRFGIGNSRFHYSDREEYVDSVYLGAWPRRVFDQYGLFNEELVRNQDDEFNYRLRANGEKLLLSPKIKSTYYSRSTFRSLWRQYLQYGFWKVRVLQIHPKQMSLRQFAPFSLLSSILFLGILSLFFGPSQWALGTVISVYLIANLVACFLTARASIVLIPYLLVSFCILHFAYGLGSIAGLVAFRSRWRERKTHPISSSRG